MTAILGATGLAGFLASFALLHGGLTTMWARYVLALAVAYVVFLWLLKIWIGVRDELWDWLEFPDFLSGGGSPSGSRPVPESETSGFNPWELLEGVDLDLDLEEGVLIVLPILLAIACLVVALYVIYIAPILLAELLVDMFILTGFYRTLRHVQRQPSFYAAVRRTWLPVAGLALVLAAVGFASQRLVPEAVSIGDVLRAATQVRSEPADRPPGVR